MLYKCLCAFFTCNFKRNYVNLYSFMNVYLTIFYKYVALYMKILKIRNYKLLVYLYLKLMNLKTNFKLNNIVSKVS